MADYALDAADLALLRSPSQRFTLRCAILPAYTPTVTQWTRSGDGRDEFDWTPEANLGPSTVAVVGVPVYYNLGNAQGRDGGAIAGANKTFDWGDGSGVISPADGLISHTYSAAGTCEVLFSVTDPTSSVTFVSHRWVKVYDEWADAFDGIVEVASFSAAREGGWQATLRVTGTTGDYLTGSIVDRAGVVLWLEETWGVNDATGAGTTKTLGRTADDATTRGTFLQGYVVGDSIRADSERHEITFSVRSADYFLQQMRLTEQVYLDSAKAGYGHVRTGLTFADAVNHLLTQHTNWGTWHDFGVWREAWPNANQIGRVTLNEGTIWQALADCAQNELGRLNASRHSKVSIAPDLAIRGLTWWGAQDPPMLPFDSQNIVEITVDESPADRIGYVEITGSDPIGGTVLTGKFPASPGDVGGFERRDILCSDQGNLDAWAEQLYYALNARYRVRVTTGLPSTIGVGNVVTVAYDDAQGRVDFTAEVGGGGYRMPFVVEDVSYQIDQGAGTWRSTYTLAQLVRLRWDTGTDAWQAFDGESWGAI